MTSPTLEVLRPRDGAAVVVLHGEHDLASRDTLNRTLTRELEANELLVADLSTVLFIDSSVLGELVRANRAAETAGKRFRLQLGTEPIVKRVLEISGLLQVLEWFPTRDEALDGRRQEKQPDPLL